MSVCIHYSRPASSTNETEVFGFDVAVTRFLSAYFRHTKAETFLCRPTDMPSFEHFKRIAQDEGLDAETRCIGLDPRHPDKNLQSLACMFRPDPLVGDLIWQRQQMRGRGYATCGLVHTMSGERIVRAVGDLCLAPSENTDALICPSHAIRDAVRSLWNVYSDYINHRFGGSFSCPMQTPVIPLGIDTEKLAARVTPEKRAAQRCALGVRDDEIVLLFVGRLSFATKAHPFPMFMAAERAARRSRHPVRLVLFGYFLPKDMEPRFRALAADVCKTARVDFVTNDDPRFPDGLWAAADIFTSLSDNVQESFGLTPIEAMACGLPAVVTDWDGYREGVRDGVDGFLIPTIAPPPEAGMAIARMYYNENNYGVALSGALQSTAVDIDACAKAYATLIDDAALRATFGRNGEARARSVFDWEHVIGAYNALWQHLAEQRAATVGPAPLPESWPAAHLSYPNPWHMFKSFPSAHMAPTDVVHIAASPEDVDLLLRHDMNLFVPQLLLSQEQLLELIAVIRRAGAARIQDILAPFPLDSHDLLWRCLGWMVKFGVCTLERRVLP
ncbi:MAG: glycosyltransferase family 4 protein [Alphaproteobacteria bacterium]|nr:glycosyltransferase family 4 protein [Alphaproteobacteria bacterium]